MAQVGARPALSVIMVSWNTREDLRQCLESHFLACQHVPEGVETLVVDNHSTDGSLEYLRQLARTRQDLTVLENPTNLGFVAGCNMGLARAKGDFLLLLNPDTILFSDTYAKAISFAREKGKFGVLGIRTQNPDLSLQPSVWPEPRLSILFLETFFLHRLLPRNMRGNILLSGHFDHNKTRAVGYVLGSFFLISRGCFEQLGGLDAQIFMFGEDLEYCMRARRHGFETIFFDKACYIHKGNRSTKQNPPAWRVKRTVSSLYYVLSRYHTRLWLFWFCVLENISFLLRAMVAPFRGLGGARTYVEGNPLIYFKHHLAILRMLVCPRLALKLLDAVKSPP